MPIYSYDNRLNSLRGDLPIYLGNRPRKGGVERFSVPLPPADAKRFEAALEVVAATTRRLWILQAGYNGDLSVFEELGSAERETWKLGLKAAEQEKK